MDQVLMLSANVVSRFPALLALTLLSLQSFSFFLLCLPFVSFRLLDFTASLPP